MWLFTKYGFFSVVSARADGAAKTKRIDPSKFMIRSRNREHLVNLMSDTDVGRLLDNPEIIETPDADYPYRIIVDRGRWIAAIAILVGMTMEDNFKKSVRTAMPDDQEFHKALNTVWGVMRNYQQAVGE